MIPQRKRIVAHEVRKRLYAEQPVRGKQQGLVRETGELEPLDTGARSEFLAIVDAPIPGEHEIAGGRRGRTIEGRATGRARSPDMDGQGVHESMAAR
jgi:hypothetical protein